MRALPKKQWKEAQQIIRQKLQAADRTPALHDDCVRAWKAAGGESLEAPLRSGAIRLLDAQWLINYALYNGNDNEKTVNKILPYRQQLPDEAFLTVEQIMQNTESFSEPSTFGGGRGQQLQIICLSYMWLHPEHPDPKGTTLQLVIRACQGKLRKHINKQHKKKSLPRYGLFWDFCSLHQHPDAARGIYRTPQEEALFREGMDSLATLFSHPGTECFKVTQFPKGYPQDYNLPQGSNCAEYRERGWPFVECCWMSLAKYTTAGVRDISQTKNGIRSQVPFVPKRLQEKLEHVTFTNASQDLPLVMRLYTTKFHSHFGHLTNLECVHARWVDEEIVQLAEILEQGHAPCLEHINLSNNNFREAGCRALAQALTSPMAPKCISKLHLFDTQIGDSGVEALARVLVRIPTVNLGACGLGVESCRALAEAEEERTEEGVTLRELHLYSNPGIGCDGVQLLAPLVVKHLTNVSLSGCNIGDLGCQALADSALLLRHQGLKSLSETTETTTTPMAVSCAPAPAASRLQIIRLLENEPMTQHSVPHLCELLRECPQIHHIRLANHFTERFGKIFQSLAPPKARVFGDEDQSLPFSREDRRQWSRKNNGYDNGKNDNNGHDNGKNDSNSPDLRPAKGQSTRCGCTVAPHHDKTRTP